MTNFEEMKRGEKKEFIKNEISRQNILDAIEKDVVKKHGEEERIRRSKKYFMLFDGNRYSPKYVITETYKYVYDEELSRDFSPSFATNILKEDMGFDTEYIENPEDDENNSRLEGEENMKNNSNNISEEKIDEEYKELVEQGKVEFITFHPSYSYEEFIEGITVNSDSEGSSDLDYMIKDGVFKRICARALACAMDLDEEEGKKYGNVDKVENKNDVLDSTKEDAYNWKSIYEKYKKKLEEYKESYLDEYKGLKDEEKKIQIEKDFEENEGEDNLKPIHKIYWNETCEDPNKRYLLIIDEINRADISKVFGELITLLEKDKRLGAKEEKIARLTYSSQEFAVPPNVYLLGTMNTADRSIALIDVALRRRFSFEGMYPDFEHLKEHFEVESDGDSPLSKSIEKLKSINKKIREEKTLGRDKTIGQSYFYQLDNKDYIEGIKRIWFYEIFPLLEEYCWGKEEKLKEIIGDNDIFEGKDGIRSALTRQEHTLMKWLGIDTAEDEPNEVQEEEDGQ